MRKIMVGTLSNGELKVSDLTLRKILDDLPTSIAINSLSNDHELVFLNKQFLRTFGYSSEEIPTASAWALLAYPDEQYRKASMDWWAASITHAIMHKGNIDSKEFRVRCKDGVVRDVLISATIMDEVMLTSLVDLTPHKQAEQRLRISEERYRLLVNNSMDLIWTMDLDGNFNYVSPVIEKMRGFTSKEFLEKPWSQLFTADSLKKAQKGLEDARANVQLGLPIDFRQELEEICKDGSTIWTEVRATSLYNDEGRFIEALGISRDISERRRIENMLRISEERHRLLAENTKDVIWTMGLDRVLTYVSPSVEKMRGFTVDEAIRQTTEQTLAPKSCEISIEYFSKLTVNVKNGRPLESFRGELEYLCKGGGTVWTEVIAFPIVDPKGAFVEILGVTRDISERKRYEEDLQLARETAETANKAKTQFLAHMSHEIRTPMNGVLGLAEMLERELLSSEQRLMVENIITAGRSLLSIINDILDFSKIEAGQLPIEPKPFDLTQTVRNVVSIFSITAKTKDLNLRLEPSPDIVGRWLGDAQRIQQILFNLIGNAIKFTERGGVVVQLIQKELNDCNGRLRFEVHDSGIGVSPEFVDHLFNPFTQADGSISRTFGGTGLGLSICKQLVDMMGGEIGVISEVSQGSVFWFELTLKRVPQGADSIENEVASTGQSTPDRDTVSMLKGVRVLVAEDNAINQLLIELMLKESGIVVTLTSNGQQALQLLNKQPKDFDMVLMDIQMPIVDGLTATQEIRKNSDLASLPVIALTAGVLEEERKAALAAGVDDFMTKPVSQNQLVETLLRHLKPTKKKLVKISGADD